MMTPLVVLCVEDEVEVRDALVRDLAPFTTICRFEEAETATEAREIVADCIARGEALALVLCDHLLPGELGVDFLVSLNADPATEPARKILVTGQAGHEDTIKAVNEAGLDYYIAKPWTVDDLHKAVRGQLTDYAIDEIEDLLPLVHTLDAERMLAALKEREHRV